MPKSFKLTTLAWITGAALTLGVAAAALALSIVALTQDTPTAPEPVLLEHTHDVPRHAHDVPEHAHEVPEHEHEESEGFLELLSLIAFLAQQSDGGLVVVEEPYDEPGDYVFTEDEHYVRDLCVAGFAFDAAISDIETSDLDEAEGGAGLAELFVAIFSEPLYWLVEDLTYMVVPTDLLEYHNEMTDRFGEVVALLEGDLDDDETRAEIERVMSTGIATTFPPEVAERLAQAANGVDECFGSFFLYSFLGGGG